MNKFKQNKVYSVAIKENSLIAKVAAYRLGAKRLAIVLNKNIYLYNTDKQSFVKNKPWLRHELKHVEQYRKYGTIKFIILYTYESIKHGYYNNKFEKEAREAESDDSLLHKYSIE